MSQSIDPYLAPAMAEADATVAALQGAPSALMPGVTPPLPPPAVAPLPATEFPSGAGTTPADPSLGPTPGYADALPGAPAPGVPAPGAPVSSIGPTPGYADAAPSAPPAGAPPQPDGTVVKGQRIEQPSTPGQAAAGAALLDTAQNAEQRATEQATREAARDAVIEAFQQRAVELVARQKNEFETAVAVKKHERTQSELAAASKDELDPARVFTGGGGAWPIIQTLLAVASGGLVGGLGGSLLMLSGGINRAVRDDIARQKEAQDSRLAYLTKVFGDEELALQRLKAEQYNLIQLTNASLAADARARKALSAAVPLQDALVAEHAREDVAFRKAHETKVITEVVGQQFLEMTQPKGPTARPGLAPETAEEAAIWQKHGVDRHSPAFRQFNEARAKIAPVTGAVRDAKTVLEAVAQGQDVPGFGNWDEFTLWLSRQAQEGNEAAANAVQTIGFAHEFMLRDLSGAAVTAPEEKRVLEKLLSGRFTTSDLRRGLDIVDKYAARKVSEWDRQYPEFNRAAQEVEQLGRSRKLGAAMNKEGFAPLQESKTVETPSGRKEQWKAKGGLGLPGDSEFDETAVDNMLTEGD
jgi:hypothetical protein